MDQFNNTGIQKLLAKPEIGVVGVNVGGIATLEIERNSNAETSVCVGRKVIEWKGGTEELFSTLNEHGFVPTSIVFIKN